jgi:REP element-mobilizing transposase RayT
MQSWLITWRTYGTWLPGQPGFVGHYRPTNGARRIDNQFDTAPADAMPQLERYARGQLKTDPVRLCVSQAERVRDQLGETCRYRQWSLRAVAVLTDHVHVVIRAPDTASGTDILRDLKSYSSRALNGDAGVAARWWAERGSTRKLIGDLAEAGAVEYVLGQVSPLYLWADPEPPA